MEGDYPGMSLRIDALDQENLVCFRHCAAHLQRCVARGPLRHPPTSGCPGCGWHCETKMRADVSGVG